MSEIEYVYHPFIYTNSNGSQILISVYVGASIPEAGLIDLMVTMAIRPDRHATWGAPIRFQAAP